jgi:hypothetical protein
MHSLVTGTWAAVLYPISRGQEQGDSRHKIKQGQGKVSVTILERCDISIKRYREVLTD